MKFKRLIATLLIVLTVIAVMPVSMYAASDTVTVIACSDFQHPDGNGSGKTVVSDILDAMAQDGITSADGFICCGDYDYEYTDTAGGVTALTEAVSDVVTENRVFVQGNHDSAIGTNGMSQSGNNDCDDYGVFVINEDDYMWFNSSEDTVKRTAQNLVEYLNEKLSIGYSKPIFVVSHLPLHYNMRTKNDGDGMHANYIFDALNEAGGKGLNIIFMFGHNHSNGWDDYLGGASVWLEKGDEILIAQNSKTEYTSNTLNFTYLNAGYVGYYRNVNGADDTLTMTVFEISDTEVSAVRYSSDGLHQLKSSGVTNSYRGESGYDPYTGTYASPQRVALTSVTDKTPIEDIIQRPTSGKNEGECYTRITSTSQLKDGGQYLLVYNDSTDYIMMPTVVTKSNGSSSRKGFDIKSSTDFGGDLWIDELSEYLWSFKKSGDGWLIGTKDGYITFTSTSDLAVTATLESTGGVFTVGGGADAFTFSDGTYVLNYNGRGLINGYASNPAAFYIYEFTGVTGTAGPDAAYSFDIATGVLTIEGTGEVWKGVDAEYKDQVKEIVIGEGITTLTDCLFCDYYTSLEKITLPSTLTTIGKWAFFGTALTEIKLPEALTSVGDYAFYGVALENVTFAGTRAKWDNITVGTNNEALNIVVCANEISEAITETAQWTFDGNDTLYIAGTGYYTADKNIVPDDIAESIKHIVIDNTIAGFGAYSFTNLTNLETVTGGENMRYLGIWAFSGLTKLTTVEFTSSELFGVLGYGAFSGCSSLDNVTLSDSLKVIGGAAFKNCTSLTSIVIPENITTVAHRMFEGCTALETVDIKGAAELENDVFYGCTSLKSVTLPEGLTTVGAWCFAGARVETLTLPSTLTAVGDYAFYWTTLGTVNYTGDISTVTVGIENSRLTDKI